MGGGAAQGPTLFTVVGPGRVGSALARALEASGALAGPVIRRGGLEWADAPPGRRPVLLCTGAQDLAAALAECPPDRRADLVFTQNGAIEPWLAAQGLEASATRALLYLSAAEDGRGGLRDGGGLSVASGPWAAETRLALGAAGVAAREVPREGLPRLAFCKLLWSSVFWCLSAGRGGAPVGELVRDLDSRAEVEALARELLAVGGPAYGLCGDDEAELVTDLVNYSLSIPLAVPSTAIAQEELPWRNGFFLRRGRSPLHLAALRRALSAADLRVALARSGGPP